MKALPERRAPDRTQSLTKVLEQSEHVTELIKHSAKELSSANTDIKRELANKELPLEVDIALEKSAAVEDRLLDASDKLTGVTRALEIEVRERTLVDHQLAAAVEQEGGARHAAFHDFLTGLPNRALFNDRLEHEIAQAKRHQWILAVMFVDLDQFKSINDHYGHDAGDAVLQAVAKRLTENTRDEDTVSRRSGDEFLYLLTQIHEEVDLAMIAAKILKAIQAPCSVTVHGHDASPSIVASIGIATFPKDGATAAALIKSADAAMYRAKQGKSGYAFAQ